MELFFVYVCVFIPSYYSANCTSTTQWSRCPPRASCLSNSHTALLPLHIHTVNISVRGVFDHPTHPPTPLLPPPLLVSAEAWALCVSRPHELGTVTASRRTTLWQNGCGETPPTRMEAADGDAGRLVRPASAWLLAGRTRLRCSEESSSASPSGRSSSAASRCPGSQTRSCSRRHLGTRTRISELVLVALIFCCFCMKMKSFFFTLYLI